MPLLIRWLVPAHRESRDSLQVPYFERLVALSGETPRTGASIRRRLTIQGLASLLGWAAPMASSLRTADYPRILKELRSRRDITQEQLAHRLGVTFAVAVVLSIASEAAQIPTPRNASIKDLIANIAEPHWTQPVCV